MDKIDNKSGELLFKIDDKNLHNSYCYKSLTLKKRVSCRNFKSLILKLSNIRCFIIVFIFIFPLRGHALGVLTHEALIDAAWDKSIVPLLKEKYPHATKEDLNEAHAYAYGGAVSPDMGYYPFGSTAPANKYSKKCGKLYTAYKDIKSFRPM